MNFFIDIKENTPKKTIKNQCFDNPIANENEPKAKPPIPVPINKSMTNASGVFSIQVELSCNLSLIFVFRLIFFPSISLFYPEP